MTHHALMLGARRTRVQLYDAVLDSLGRPTYDEYGRVKVGASREIEARWEIGRREVPGPDGHLVAVDGTAYVDEKIYVGSRMRLGDADILPGTFAAPDDALMEVVDYREVPDIKGRQAHRVVLLRRFTDTNVT